MNRNAKTLLWLAALALLSAAVGGWWWWRGVAVDAVTLHSAPLVRTLQFSARVATLSRVEIGSTVTGRVAQVLVDEGAQVHRGDVLVQLEADEQRAALAQAVAAEQQAQARVAGLRSSGRSAAQAALAQAEATLVAARQSFARAQQLVAEGFYSAAQLDEARRALGVAQAQQGSARAQVQANADAGTEVVQAQAQVALARAATAAAQARLAQLALLAPTDARVLLRAVEPGQIVQPGKALLSLALAGPTQLVAQVDERFLDQLQPDQSATVVADAFPAQRFAARVLSIAPAVDAQRGAIEVKLVLEGTAPAYLREDMTLSVEVETARRDSALVLPLALLRAQDTVLVLQDGRAQLRSVRLGLRTLDAAEVLDGLAAGEVVLQGSALQPGQRVRARLMAAATKGSNASNASNAPDAGAALSNAIGR